MKPTPFGEGTTLSLSIVGDNEIVSFAADANGSLRGPTAKVRVDPETREIREASSKGDAGAAKLPELVAELQGKKAR